MANQPLWATPERQDHLVKMFIKSRGFCVQGHQQCEIESHNYAVWVEDTVDFWKSEDRDFRSYRNKLEAASLNDGTYGRWGSDFDPVALNEHHRVQPVYYLVREGVDGLTLRRIAQIRIPSTYIHLFVDVHGLPEKIGKNARKKHRLYGKPLPMTRHDALLEAVARFYAGAKH